MTGRTTHAVKTATKNGTGPRIQEDPGPAGEGEGRSKPGRHAICGTTRACTATPGDARRICPHASRCPKNTMPGTAPGTCATSELENMHWCKRQACLEIRPRERRTSTFSSSDMRMRWPFHHRAQDTGVFPHVPAPPRPRPHFGRFVDQDRCKPPAPFCGCLQKKNEKRGIP